MVDEHSPMPDVIAGLKSADDIACYEFCRRQRPNTFEALVAGADHLGLIAFELECRQPDTLLILNAHRCNIRFPVYTIFRIYE
jgi:hypothetical protein